MNSTLITIIIATFNADESLQNCLDSIIPQLNSNCELIIIDGASKDDTVNIIDRNSEFVNFTISEPDKGIYDAWNKGVRASNGQWVMFIGADDELLPNAINIYLNLLRSKDLRSYDYISAQNEYIDMDGRLIKLLGNGADWKLMKKGNSAAHVASLHSKKNLFETVGYYNLDFKICSDYEILLRKRDNLKSFFLQERIVRMKAGGMSFSVRAIKEAYEIRKLHKTVSLIFNRVLFLRDYLAYKIFKLRKSV